MRSGDPGPEQSGGHGDRQDGEDRDERQPRVDQGHDRDGDDGVDRGAGDVDPHVEVPGHVGGVVAEAGHRRAGVGHLRPRVAAAARDLTSEHAAAQMHLGHRPHLRPHDGGVVHDEAAGQLDGGVGADGDRQVEGAAIVDDPIEDQLQQHAETEGAGEVDRPPGPAAEEDRRPLAHDPPGQAGRGEAVGRAHDASAPSVAAVRATRRA